MESLQVQRSTSGGGNSHRIVSLAETPPAADGDCPETTKVFDQEDADQKEQVN